MELALEGSLDGRVSFQTARYKRSCNESEGKYEVGTYLDGQHVRRFGAAPCSLGRLWLWHRAPFLVGIYIRATIVSIAKSFSFGAVVGGERGNDVLAATRVKGRG